MGFGSDNTLPAIFDLDRVEVLRGPQGTLYGANSEGGLLKFVTAPPVLGSFSGAARELSRAQSAMIGEGWNQYDHDHLAGDE